MVGEKIENRWVSPRRANSQHNSEVDLQPFGTKTSQRPHQVAMRTPQKGGVLKIQAICHIAAPRKHASQRRPLSCGLRKR